jgi:xanthine dehydrogenase YagS FAD-binding subunit
VIGNIADIKEIERALSWLSSFWKRPAHVNYNSPETIDEAIALLEKHGGEAKLLAGGIDIIRLLKSRIIAPRELISLKRLDNLRYIKTADNCLEIGALATINDISKSPLVNNQHQALHEAAMATASPHIRSMATMAGNLCQEAQCWYYRRSPETGITFNCRRKITDGICYAVDGENQYHAVIGGNKCFAVCPSDSAIALAAFDAIINTVDTSGGRDIPVTEFYTSTGNVLGQCEIVRSIQVPGFPPGARSSFTKFRLRKAIDFAIASLATRVTINNDRVSDIRLVFGGVSPAPYRAIRAEDIIKGEKLTETTITEAANASVCETTPLGKNDYKVSIMQAMVKKTLQQYMSKP